MPKKDILVNGIVVGSYEATGDYSVDVKTAEKIIKEKGLYKEITDNDRMFSQANSFAGIANDIYKDSFSSSPYKVNNAAPFVVNASFSIEIYLKTIHNAYGNNIKGHHLANIYKEMPKKGKEHFDNAAHDIRPKYKLDEGDNIISCLNSVSKAFEEWRYIYEKNNITVGFNCICYVMHTSFEAAYRVRSRA